jgi:hypothetical protein
MLILAAALVGAIVGIVSVSARLEGQATRSEEAARSGVFTPAHDSFGAALSHFLGIRSEPVQPIAYSHRLHVADVDLGCTFCHDGVSVGPQAGIPGVGECMLCHSEVGLGLPEVQALRRYYDDGVEPPWERVYGWPEEAHVRFNHRPHHNAGVGCETCHGDVSGMDAAERAVEHSMDFCVNCHDQRQASNECTACHY